MHGPSRKSGFVLLMVLMVLVIAGTILASTARRSGGRALLAAKNTRDLQLKWGTLSCRAVLLPQAEFLLADREASDGPVGGPTVRRSVALGGMEFVLIVSDEQAKANVNYIAHSRGNAQVAASLSALQSRLRRVLLVRPRPEAIDIGITGVPIRYVSFDQLVAFDRPSDLVRWRTPEETIFDKATCWGSGKVNFKRAPAAVMREAAAGLLTETQLAQLHRFRQDNPDCTLKEALVHLELSKKKIGQLEAVLTDVSQCHSLWVIVPEITRDRHRLYVHQAGDAENDSQDWIFHW